MGMWPSPELSVRTGSPLTSCGSTATTGALCSNMGRSCRVCTSGFSTCRSRRRSISRRVPGLETYIREMQKYQPSSTYDEVALDGWVSAALFVSGLKAVGRNLTQKKLVAAVNAETAFTGGGLTTPVNWKTAHTRATPPYCHTTVRVVDGACPGRPGHEPGIRVFRFGKHHTGCAAARHPGNLRRDGLSCLLEERSGAQRLRGHPMSIFDQTSSTGEERGCHEAQAGPPRRLQPG